LAPSTLSLIRNMFLNSRQRTVAIAVWITSFSAGGAIGALVGGVLLERFWWGSVFLLAVARRHVARGLCSPGHHRHQDTVSDCAGGSAAHGQTRLRRDLVDHRPRPTSGTLLRRLPMPAEVANVATIMASDRASAMTGVIANVTCGALVDL